MHRVRLFTVAISLLAALAFPTSALAAEPLQWSNTPQSAVREVLPNKSYSLSNDTGGSVKYGSRTFGVDLVWGGGAEWQFRRANPRDHRSIPNTESVALYNTRHRRYLNYGSQRFGINLVWSESPRYQWKVNAAQIQAPAPGAGNERVSLYNTAARSYLIYMQRRFGINLGWQAG